MKFWIPFILLLLAGVEVSGLPAYPLKASPDNRYLVDANGAPFLIMGDAPHYIIKYISDTAKTTYLVNRGTNGFNAVQIELLVGWGNPNDINKGNDYYGNHPFTGLLPDGTNYDLTTPNEAYWVHVDWLLQTAATNGLLGMLVPLDQGGVTDLGYNQIAKANGSNNCYTYGQFLGNRYKNYTNIIWEMGNDFFLWTNSVYDSVILGLAKGIKSADTNHLMTIQLTQPGDSLVDTNWNNVVTLNSIYEVSVAFDWTLIAYHRTNYLPVLFLEGRYESDSSPPITANQLRRQSYWALMAGSIAGYMYGNGYIWPFKTGWQTNLNTVPVQQMKYWRDFMTTRAWYNLVPNSNQVVTAGYGTYKTDYETYSVDYSTVAKTPDGTLAMVYAPTNHTLTVQMTNFVGPVTARWYDPSANTFTTITGSPFANTITTNLATPGSNAAGDGDWVLLLETQPAETQPPSVTLTAPAIGAIISNTIPVSATATDNVAVVGVQFQVDGAYLGAEVVSAPYSNSWNTLTGTNGSHMVQAIARDAAGNRATNSASVTVSNAPSFPPAQPAFIQQNYSTTQTPQTQVSVIYLQAQTAGNANLLAIGWNDMTASISGVSDSAGNLYQAAVPIYRGNGLSQGIYYSAGIRAGSNTVTVTFVPSAVYVDLRATEYSGLSLTNPFDAGNSGAGSGPGASSGTVTTTMANELLFGAGMTATTFSAPGVGFTQWFITSPNGDIVEALVSPAPGPYSATATLSSGAWLMQVAAFKATILPSLIPPQITAATFSGSNFVIRFTTVLGQSYELQRTADPAGSTWLPVATNIAGIGVITQVVDTNALGQVQRFYRVKTGA
jgi:hypothetical protein